MWVRDSGRDSGIKIACFFSLFQRQNHFSLLEVNESEGCIYHYDPIGKEENADIKVCIESSI